MTQIYSHLQQQRLSNGLRVWCLPRPHTGTVAILAHFPVGGRTETKQNNGISHFLEHMLFTGTERWDESEIADVIRQRGGHYNAQTSREETVFYLHIDAEDLDFGLDWLHQVLFTPRFAPDKFEKERQVIMNEKGGEYDRLQTVWEWIEDRNLGWSIIRAFRRRVYPNSPMMLPIIGRDKTLKSITYQGLVDYYHAYYVPHNMTLIVVGDVEPEKVFALATQHFEAVPDRPSPIPHPPFKIVPKPFSVRLNGPMPNDQGQYMVSVLLGDGHHPDRFAWWVIEEMLDNATTREIRFKLGLTYSVNIFTSLYVDTGYFGAYVRAKVKDLPTIRHCIETYLDQLVTGDFSENDLREAQNAIRGRTLLDLQDNLEMAIWLGFDALHTLGQEGRVEDYFAKIDAVTVDDIHRVAKEYFARDKRFMLEHQPMLTPRQIRPAALGLLGATTALWSLQKYRRRNR